MQRALLFVLTMALTAPVAAQRPVYTAPSNQRPGAAPNETTRLTAMNADMTSAEAYIKAWLDEYYVDGRGTGQPGRYCQVLDSRANMPTSAELPVAHDRKGDAPHYTRITGQDCLGNILNDNEFSSIRVDIYTFGRGANDRGAYVTFTLEEAGTRVASCGFQHCHAKANPRLCAQRMPANKTCVAGPSP